MDEVPKKLPIHVAVIMDGNGRWAHARGLPRTQGHMEGAESARAVAKCCVEFGIPYLTLYAFSTENWRRPQDEVEFLMLHLARFLVERREELAQNSIRLQAIGRIGELPEAVQRELRGTMEATRNASALTLTLALNYGSRSEIVDACRELAARVQAGALAPDQIDEERISGCLYTRDVPDPDLLIRTGGERRVSNFLLWQISYAELCLTDVLWPDFRREAFLETLRDYAKRERRFGGLAEAHSKGEADTPR
jgi:undecaprenyl diphosphate synthase